MRRRVPATVLLMFLSAFLMAGTPASAVDDLSVKMWYPDTVKAGQSTGVSIEIRNENYDYPVNITWTGINIEWMAPGDFAHNATGFRLSGGQSKIVNITFQVPKDAVAKTYSNYEVIYYTVQNGTQGEWNDATWESTITEDFKVVKGTPPTNEGGLFQDLYSKAMANITCLCIGVILIVVIVAVATAARRGAFRRMRTRRIGDISVRPSSSPPPDYPAPEFPPPAYEEKKELEISPPIEKPAPVAPAPVQLPLPAPSPVPAQETAGSKPAPPAVAPYSSDRGVDLMKPTDWDAIGKPAPVTPPGPAADKPAASLGPKFCTYCGIGEPGPVCRNCGRRLV